MTRQLLIGALIGGTGTALLLLAWARFYRWRHQEEERRLPLHELSRRFHRWEVLGVVLMLAAMFASWLGFLWFAGAYPRHPDAVHYLGANGWHWAAAAFCAGNLLATAPTHWLFQWWMGRPTYAEFRAYQTRKFGYDAHRWLPVFYAGFSVVTVKLTLLLYGWGVALTPDTITLEPFWWSETHRYTYDQLLQVHVAEGSADGTTLELRFDDGRWWRVPAFLYGASAETIEAAAAYASERSGLPVTR